MKMQGHITAAAAAFMQIKKLRVQRETAAAAAAVSLLLHGGMALKVSKQREFLRNPFFFVLVLSRIEREVGDRIRDAQTVFFEGEEITLWETH